jgi:hypothetical protein
MAAAAAAALRARQPRQAAAAAAHGALIHKVDLELMRLEADQQAALAVLVDLEQAVAPTMREQLH